MPLDLTFLTPAALLALRIIVAIVFFSSGKGHATNPKERGEGLGLSPTITAIVGWVEIIAAIMIAVGIFAQIGALLIIVAMLGAIKMKLIDWNTGFYSDEGYGWHYDVLFVAAALVILATNGGAYIII